VIIPARDAPDTLPRAIESVRSQDYGEIVEIVVAAADVATAEAAYGATVVMNPKRSTPVGLNLAIGASSGEIVVRCDAQSVLPVGYVSRAVETLERTGAAVVGGMQIPVGSTPWERAIAAAMSSPLGAGDARYRVGGEEGPVETVYLGVFRREILERLGGYDESFGRTQDYELNHRIAESGGLVWFDPELEVEYTPRGSLGTLWEQYFGYGRAKRQFGVKHPGSLRWRQLAPPFLVAVLGVSLLVSIWFPIALAVPATYVAAILVAGVAMGSFRSSLALATMHVAWGTGFLSAGASTRAVTP
jgi:glycosyltransferase involved in cell wall biosynthesis